MSRTIALAACVWFIAGCAMSEDLVGYTDQAVLTPNGVNPNGVNPNGVNPNGVNPNGVNPNGISFNGVNPNGVNPNGTAIGIAISGPPLAGPEAIGSTWTGNLSTGTTVALRIDDAAQLTGRNADMWSYRMSISDDGTWRPLCLDPAGTPIFADTMAGTWNLLVGVAGGGSYNAAGPGFSIACRGSAIAKCLELGYKPWAGHDRELATCVRALRGDYCGDGTPYTVTGTMVNIYDAGGIQTDDAAWDAEAEWTPNGASCVSKKKETRFDQDAHQRPWCFPHALKPQKSCGTGFHDDTMIITELPAL
jgi:hypothetical protein